MNFFKSLAETGIKDVILQVKQDDKGNVTVFVTPKSVSDNAKIKMLKPIHITGTPEELDTEFFTIVSAPLTKIQSVFSNIEEFEAETKAIQEEASKKKAEASKKKEKSSEGDKKEEAKETEPKVNHETVLKEFIATIKDEPIIGYKEKIEELLANLDEKQLGKPLAKKVRNDLDIAIRKEANIQAAKEKYGFVKPAETPAPVEETKTEEVVTTADITVVHEEVSPVDEVIIPNEENVGQEEESAIAAYEAKHAEVDVTPAPIPAPAPPVEAVPQFEEYQELEMIATDGTYEDYKLATWTDEQLVQHGKAKWVTKQRPVVVPTEQPKKLSYTFPKEFDSPEVE